MCNGSAFFDGGGIPEYFSLPTLTVGSFFAYNNCIVAFATKDEDKD